eukprot:jgi/Mesvir1/28791/Mv12451-RA.1
MAALHPSNYLGKLRGALPFAAAFFLVLLFGPVAASAQQQAPTCQAGCPPTVGPVCGFRPDLPSVAITYQNPCYARCSDASVALERNCGPTPEAAVPACQACPPPSPGSAVCASNGVSYQSPCLAQCLNVSVAAPGICPRTIPIFPASCEPSLCGATLSLLLEGLTPQADVFLFSSTEKGVHTITARDMGGRCQGVDIPLGAGLNSVFASGLLLDVVQGVADNRGGGRGDVRCQPTRAQALRRRACGKRPIARCHRGHHWWASAALQGGGRHPPRRRDVAGVTRRRHRQRHGAGHGRRVALTTQGVPRYWRPRRVQGEERRCFAGERVLYDQGFREISVHVGSMGRQEGAV